MTGDISLAGRTAFITGASSGLGARFAEVFAAAGANVVLGARRLDRIAGLADRLNGEGGSALAVAMDVTSEDSIVAAFDTTERRFGVPDTIVANAGIIANGRSTEVEGAEVRAVLETNLLGVYLTAREAARRLIASGSREREHGRILVIGSITARVTGHGDAAYSASKAAVAHLARQFAREWVRQGINVNVIEPGYISTEINGDWFETAGGMAQIAGFHRRRLLVREALDHMALYLASDASRQVTGSVIPIDDGQSL